MALALAPTYLVFQPAADAAYEEHVLPALNQAWAKLSEVRCCRASQGARRAARRPPPPPPPRLQAKVRAASQIGPNAAVVYASSGAGGAFLLYSFSALGSLPALLSRESWRGGARRAGMVEGSRSPRSLTSRRVPPLQSLRLLLRLTTPSPPSPRGTQAAL